MGMMMCIVENASADEFKLTPSLAVKEEYNDNVLYTHTDIQRDFIATISPGLALTDKTERMDLSMLARLDHRLYSSHKELDATDQYYEITGKYAFTPRLNFSGKTLYSRDSRTDRDLETTGLSLSSVKRERQNHTASGDYILSEKTMTTFSYDYLNDKYHSDSFTDLESHTFNLGFIRDISNVLESTKATMNTGYAKYNMPGMKIDNYEATMGIDRAFSEKWNLAFNGGARYTDSRFTIRELAPVLIERDERNRGWGAVGQLTLAYKGERGNSNGSLSVAHNILPASGRSGASERTSFIVNIRKRITYELYGTLWAGYFINRSDSNEFSTQKIDEDSINLNPGVRYEFDKDKSIEASYGYSWTKYNLSNTHAQRNTFFVRFRIQHHLFE
jgi:predicted porin